MHEVILAFLIPGVFVGLWIWLVPTPESVYTQDEEVADQPEIMENLICIGGPLDGEFVEVPRRWKTLQAADHSPEPVDYYSNPDTITLKEQPAVTVVTYLRGEIVFPERGRSYKYLYAEGLDKYLSGVRAAHVIGHRSKR